MEFSDPISMEEKAKFYARSIFELVMYATFQAQDRRAFGVVSDDIKRQLNISDDEYECGMEYAVKHGLLTSRPI